MPTLTTLRKAILISLYGSAALAAFSPAAQAQNTEAAATDGPVQTVSVVGSRRVASSATDTMVPVDIIPISKVAEQGGQFDLAQSLQYISPSFNSTRQTGADGADLVDSAALRGLGSDQTLVLVNGKRRHTTALVNLFGARNRGNTGTDMNA
ncbi:MAG: TonB-dependent receptor plug domain-containing protein, partial [Janthinobacterium sp.]